jgi:hypothetical protein
VSLAPKPDLRALHRTATIVAIALMAAVVTCWSLVPTLARLGTLKPAFAGNARIGYLALALGVIVVVVAGIVRRATLAGSAGEPGARLFAASIVSSALAEVPGLLGLVVYMLTGLPTAAYPLFVLSLAALLLYFPRWSQWEEWTKPG